MENKDKEKKKVDPGWNDPPMLNYSPSNPPPKSRITNKRVPFPLTTCSPGTSSSNTLPLGSTPPKAFIVSPPMPIPQNQEVSEELFKNAKDNFGKFILTQKSQKTKECIHLLYKLWEEGKFSNDCQKNIYLMSQYLAENDDASAKIIKDRLLTEFKDSCEDWLVNFVI
ncbi:steroid receptor RNA activator 1-like [Anoplophora glabripennis]|uniref:steroid receptor RNA activator 1-like n=1 Tax=Anoplophora glabripennis TaxID=217634 RepID=UPI0008738F79|nr:steroid receptor RNA activator 1-like [Anoplophora glabripennis]